MDLEKKQQVIRYIEQQIKGGDVRTKGYVFDTSGKKYPNRNCFVVLRKYLQNYIARKDPSRLFLLYGLRGTGKTTLLAQMYDEVKHVPKERKLFLSLDEISNLLGVTLYDVLRVYEEVLGSSFETLSEPVFLFLDEIHFDDDWVVLLKTIYDKTQNVFVVATGSSALALQTTPDLARRAISIKLYPMQFTEYIKIRDGKFETPGLSKKIRDIIFHSKSASDVYHSLSSVKPEVQKYWSSLGRGDIDLYLKYGTFPFVVISPSDAVAFDQIKKTLEKVVSVDMVRIEKFSSDIISRVPSVLYTLASSDKCNLNSVSKSIGINRHTLASILETLEKTETVWRLYPYGSHHSQVRKPSKYLFTSPAFRSMYFSLTESVSQHDDYKGKVFEDVVGLSLQRIFSERFGFSITYDSADGGADFVIRQDEASLVFEVGYGKKNISQVVKTMNRMQEKVSYGVLISQNPLVVHPDDNIVEIPISYFLLV